MLEAMKNKFQKQKSISDKYYREAITDWGELGITKDSLKKLFLILLKITLFVVGIVFLCMFSWIYIGNSYIDFFRFEYIKIAFLNTDKNENHLSK